MSARVVHLMVASSRRSGKIASARGLGGSVVAYHIGMRRGEIVAWRRDQVDLKRVVIRLRTGDTKTDDGHTIPLNQALRSLFGELPRGLGQTRVCLNPVADQP
jgi:integrase